METNIDELSSQLSTLTTKSQEISKLDHRLPLSTFRLPSMSSCPMATDDYNHLLIFHHQRLILFQLPTFEILFFIPTGTFTDCQISDICFYTFSNCFLLSSANTIYSLASDRSIKLFQKFSNTIWSITYTSTSIFVCYLFGASMEQWDFSSKSAFLVNSWVKEDLLEAFDQGINCIRAVNQCIGMTIKERNFSWRIDIFDSLTMTRLRRGSTIQQGNGLSNWIGILFPIDSFRWLFADGDEGLFLINQTDEQNYQQNNIMKIACNICLLRDVNTRQYNAIVVQSYEVLQIFDVQ